MSWSRTCWGVWFTSNSRHDGFLIGEPWDHEITKKRNAAGLNGPTRCLIFFNREEAREWCRKARPRFNEKNGCAHWRFKPVRVRESVTPEPSR